MTRFAFVAVAVLSGAACRGSDSGAARADPSSKAASSSSAKALASQASQTTTVAASAAPSPSMSAEYPPGGTGMGYGGCPCGCDHSEDLVAELREEGRDTALRGIDDALHTIGEREDAGYITDRMVQHRLRLLAFGRELGRTRPARFTTVPAIRAGTVASIAKKLDSATTDASAKVRAELIFHGETTEMVNGKEKLLRASFLVRFDLENPGVADVMLRAPTLEAKTPLPVSRWYVAGGDGQAWDGVLLAGEKTLVHVVGYAGEAVQPGTEVDATIHFESLALHVKARARKRWNEVD